MDNDLTKTLVFLSAKGFIDYFLYVSIIKSTLTVN